MSGDLSRASTEPVSVRLPTAMATADLGRRLAGILRPGDLVVLAGELGAGKTTFAQGLGAALQVRGEVMSPTFVIARVHPSLVGGPDLVHVDAYRLGSLAEVDDLDLDASLEQSVTVVEWGSGKVEGLSEERLLVELVRAEGGTRDESRTATVTGIGLRWTAASGQLTATVRGGDDVA